MPEEGDRGRPRCPECGAAYEPRAEQCPLCRARLPSVVATANPNAWALSKPSAPVRRRRLRRHDLHARTANVERTVAAMAQAESDHRSTRRHVAGPTIVFGGLVSATGLLLL